MSAITRQPFGKTGHESTRIIFGAAALAMMKQARADATLEMLHEFGVNHFDVAASYGEAELRLAPWLHDHRDEVFAIREADQQMCSVLVEFDSPGHRLAFIRDLTRPVERKSQRSLVRQLLPLR